MQLVVRVDVEDGVVRVLPYRPPDVGPLAGSLELLRVGLLACNRVGSHAGVAIGQDGSVSYQPSGGGPRVTSGYLSLAKFANEGALERRGNNEWAAGANAGAEVVSTPGGTYGITQAGAVEMSNVDLASEFTNMITAQRGFQANSRIISTADQMLQDLVNLIR